MRRARRTDGVTDQEAPRPITCARPECSRQAAVRLVIDVGRCVVSMDLLVDEVGGAASLCSTHADKVIPPRDWTLEDHREMVPRLFKVSQPDGATSDEPVVVAPLKPRRSSPVFDAETALSEQDVDDEVDRPIKRRRKRIVEADEPPKDQSDDISKGQLAFENTPYDFPPGYVKKIDPTDPVFESVSDQSPDSTGSPLLARAFDAGRSRRTPSHLNPNQPPTE